MDTPGPLIESAAGAHRERAKEKQQRLAHEAGLLAQARAPAAAGRMVSEAQVDAWIDSLGTDHALPLPHSGR